MKRLFLLVYALAFLFWACSSDSDSTEMPDEKVPVEEDVENNSLPLEKDVVKNVLMELYHSTGGENWDKQPNWETEKDIHKWTFLSVEGSCINIDLSYNNLKGSLPRSLFNLKLQKLDLFGNQLSGEIPDNAGSNGMLEYLDLGKNNFTGNLPLSLTKSKFLQLHVTGNRLTGEVPSEFRKLPDFNESILVPQQEGYELIVPAPLEPLESEKMVLMEIYDCIDTHETDKMPNWKEVENPQLWDNVTWNGDGRVVELDLHKYRFKSLPSEINSLEDLVELDLFGVGLTNIPSLAGLKNLSLLNISNNNLGPTFPETIFDLKNLEYLFVCSCNFEGSMPQRLNELTNLKELDLSTNKWSGKIAVYDKLTKLVYLDLYYCNELEPQRIPEWIGNAKDLQAFDFSSCNLTGEIPESWKDHNWIVVDLTDNDLSGNVQHTFEKCDMLLYLYLGQNKFSGPLPELDCPCLSGLNLSRNKFSGPIPESWKSLVSIYDMNLTVNGITGNIPLFFKDFKNLYYLNLSTNKMSGEIPAEVLEMLEDTESFLMPQLDGYGFTNVTVTQNKETLSSKPFGTTKAERQRKLKEIGLLKN